MENTVHILYKSDNLEKGEKAYLSKGDKHMYRNTGIRTNSLEMELWI
jgi:hypothetical protein